uniref:39S ribosomal protein L1, mitochondrial-like n=1 Tax=Styela clava TaxID=7725 RepID=UPI001939442B|nr:39S ribosomal protein L1, mitochondrial-like [Styela clava]
MSAAWRCTALHSRVTTGFLEYSGIKTILPLLGKTTQYKNDCNQNSSTIPKRKFHCSNKCYFGPKKKLIVKRKAPTKEVNKLLKTPVDDVYLADLYEPKFYDILEAITTLKRYTELDFSDPDSIVKLNMQLHPAPMKKGRHQQIFSVVELPNEFEYDNKICVFTENVDIITEALQEGASRAGGDDIIQEISFGNLKFDAFVTTLEFHKSKLFGNKEATKAIGKLMPKRHSGITEDIIGKLQEFKTGTIITNLSKSENESSVVVGRINQSAEELTENFEFVMELIRGNQNPKHPPIIKNAQLNCCEEHLPLNIVIDSDLD